MSTPQRIDERILQRDLYVDISGTEFRNHMADEFGKLYRVKGELMRRHQARRDRIHYALIFTLVFLVTLALLS